MSTPLSFPPISPRFSPIRTDLSFKLNTMNDYVEITAEDLGMEEPEPWATTLGELGLE